MRSLEVLELVNLGLVPNRVILDVIGSMSNMLPGTAARIIRFKKFEGVNLPQFAEKVPSIAGFRPFAM
jgi:hypothetical protein